MSHITHDSQFPYCTQPTHPLSPGKGKCFTGAGVLLHLQNELHFWSQNIVLKYSLKCNKEQPSQVFCFNVLRGLLFLSSAWRLEWLGPLVLLLCDLWNWDTDQNQNLHQPYTWAWRQQLHRIWLRQPTMCEGELPWCVHCYWVTQIHSGFFASVSVVNKFKWQQAKFQLYSFHLYSRGSNKGLLQMESRVIKHFHWLPQSPLWKQELFSYHSTILCFLHWKPFRDGTTRQQLKALDEMCCWLHCLPNLQGLPPGSCWSLHPADNWWTAGGIQLWAMSSLIQRIFRSCVILREAKLPHNSDQFNFKHTVAVSLWLKCCKFLQDIFSIKRNFSWAKLCTEQAYNTQPWAVWFTEYSGLVWFLDKWRLPHKRMMHKRMICFQLEIFEVTKQYIFLE